MMQYYGILDWQSLPIIKVATYCAGLPVDSRLYAVDMGLTPLPTALLLGQLIDDLRSFAVGISGSNKKPDYITDLMLHRSKSDDVQTYATGEDFKRAREKLLEK